MGKKTNEFIKINKILGEIFYDAEQIVGTLDFYEYSHLNMWYDSYIFGAAREEGIPWPTERIYY